MPGTGNDGNECVAASTYNKVDAFKKRFALGQRTSLKEVSKSQRSNCSMDHRVKVSILPSNSKSRIIITNSNKLVCLLNIAELLLGLGGFFEPWKEKSLAWPKISRSWVGYAFQAVSG